ncbi:MAG: hypothetical protein GX079_04285 [Tissierellia bacterium]|nr:hypothetical protein [Tissierellia bacterium]
MVSIFSVARLLEAVLNKTASKELVLSTLLIVMAVISVRVITSILTSRTSFMAASQVKKFLRENIYSKLLDLGASYNEKVSTSEVVQVSVEGSRAVRDLLWSISTPALL